MTCAPRWCGERHRGPMGRQAGAAHLVRCDAVQHSREDLVGELGGDDDGGADHEAQLPDLEAAVLHEHVTAVACEGGEDEGDTNTMALWGVHARLSQ